jgi:hypothetical protein
LTLLRLVSVGLGEETQKAISKGFLEPIMAVAMEAES